MKNSIIILLVATVLVGGLILLRQNTGKDQMQLPSNDEGSLDVQADDALSTSDDYTVDESDLLQADDFSADVQDRSNEGVLSTNEIDNLILMREEEKLARDVYQYLYKKWKIRIFSNIARSEQTHMDAVGAMIEKYEIQDPINDMSEGSFTSPVIKDLYKDLTAQGSVSLAEALRVGAKIEDLDIYDLQVALKSTEHDDIAVVYKNLMKGSRNHMRAFNRQLEREAGESYTAEHITQGELSEVLAGSQERGQIR